MPRPGYLSVSSLSGQAGSSHPHAGWRGHRFPLVRRHVMRNGAGKPATVRILGMLLATTLGSATVAGISINVANGPQIRSRISVMPESRPRRRAARGRRPRLAGAGVRFDRGRLITAKQT
jgi:hypothetical protein